MSGMRLICSSGLGHLNGRLLGANLSYRSTLNSKAFTVCAVNHTTSKDVTKSTVDEKSKENPESAAHADTSQKMVRTHYIDKKSLVWDKRYKTMADVPEMLPFQTVVQARNRFRIRTNLFMIALTVLAAIVMVYTGKERAKTGDSVEKRTIERHRQLRAQKAEEDRAAQLAASEK